MASELDRFAGREAPERSGGASRPARTACREGLIPDPEVSEQATRRRFPMEYKARIVRVVGHFEPSSPTISSKLQT